MNLTEHVDSGSVRSVAGSRSISALKRDKKRTSFSGFLEMVSLKRAWIKDIVVITAAVLLLGCWILNFNSFDLATISFGNSLGGSDIGFHGHGENFNLFP